jgi:hypothetical protein
VVSLLVVFIFWKGMHNCTGVFVSMWTELFSSKGGKVGSWNEGLISDRAIRIPMHLFVETVFTWYRRLKRATFNDILLFKLLFNRVPLLQ